MAAISGPARRHFGFGSFRLDPERRLLYRGGDVLPLPPRAIEMLLTLVEHRGQTLAKDDLMKQLWPNTIVEENNLTVIISTLRRALGERPNQHLYIVTVPGRGYRFVADVEEFVPEAVKAPSTNIESSPPAADAMPASRFSWRWFAAAAAVLLVLAAVVFYFRSGASFRSTGTKPTLAVLPFQSTGPGTPDEFVGLGMADSLIERLGHLQKVVVRPVTAVVRYIDGQVDPLDAGRVLQVDWLLQGTARRSGERIQVTARLLRVNDGQTIWSGSYDEVLKDVFGIEDRLVGQITDALVIAPSRGEKQQLSKRYTANTSAYELYQRGRFFWNKRSSADLQKAINYFDDATKLDPKYALAYAGLADCYDVLSYFSERPPKESFPLAKAAALKALSLDDSLAEAHVSLALAKMDYDWDWKGAETEFERAIQLNGNYATAHQWYAEFLAAKARGTEARAEMARALELDPVSLIGNAAAGYVAYYDRRYNDAATLLRRTLDMDNNFWPARWFLGWVDEALGNNQDAIAQLEQARIESSDNPRITADLARSYALAGRKRDAQKLLAQLTAEGAPYASPYALALVELGLENRSGALRNLAAAIEARSWELVYLKVDPRLDSLRNDPRFAEIAKSAP